MVGGIFLLFCCFVGAFGWLVDWLDFSGFLLLKTAMSMKGSMHKSAYSILVCVLCLWRHLQGRGI